MSKRLAVSAVVIALAMIGSARPAFAQQTVNITFGVFAPIGEDARTAGDVLNANRTFLTFDIGDFRGPTIGGEWLVAIGQHVEAGAGVSFTRRTAPSLYTCCTHADQSEIEQDLRLRQIPLAFTVRVLPLGQSSAVQPYVGGGIALVNWRYSESGEFVDFNDGKAIFRDSFVDSGTATGPVVLVGVRFAGQSMSAGGEIRYQRVRGDLSSDFAGTRIDLGGWTYQATFGLRLK